LRPKIYVLALVIFLSGLIVGMALSPALLGPRLFGMLRGNPPRPHDISTDMIDRYQLVEPAASNVLRIFTEAMERIDQSRKTHFSQIQQEVETIKNKIMNELPLPERKRWQDECRHLDRLLPPQQPPKPGHRPPPHHR
jgi:hypothetical protein